MLKLYQYKKNRNWIYKNNWADKAEAKGLKFGHLSDVKYHFSLKKK